MEMRIARINTPPNGRECSARLNSVGGESPLAVARNGHAAPDVVSRILASAVLEQLGRDRGVAGDLDPEELSSSARKESSMSDAPAMPHGASAGNLQETSLAGSIPVWKRMFDCAVVLISCPFWLPLMLLIMVGIKFSSPGPIFYRQERVGYRGRRFMIFKFRTMKVNVETRVHESYFERLMQADCPMTKLDANGD